MKHHDRIRHRPPDGTGHARPSMLIARENRSGSTSRPQAVPLGCRERENLSPSTNPIAQGAAIQVCEVLERVHADTAIDECLEILRDLRVIDIRQVNV